MNQVPVIDQVDVLVIGGSLTGCALANKCSRQGLNVLIVEPSTTLGHEMTIWQRPWLKWNNNYQKLLQKWFPIDHVYTMPDETIIPLHIDLLKTKLEDNLLGANVNILFSSYVLESRLNKNLTEVLIGNKSGCQIISTKYIMDTRPVKCQLELSGSVQRTLEFTGVQSYQASYPIPPHLEILEDRISVYPGTFDESHVFIDIAIPTSYKSISTPLKNTELELHARRKSLEVCNYIIHNIPAFKDATLGLGSQQVMPTKSFDPVTALLTGEQLADNLADPPKIISCINSNEKLPFTYQEYNQFKELDEYPQIEWDSDNIPVLSETDLLVVGGGTSGATAAWAASQQGVKTILLEMNSMLGGSGTIGGVNKYWFGNRFGFTKEIDNLVADYSQRYGFQQTHYIWSKDDRWNIELKGQALLDLCIDNNVEVYFSCVVIGALTEINKVKGVVVASPFGLFAIKSKVTIDGTGDGDVACHAGASFVYGNNRDSMTMWYSLAQYTKPTITQNNFSSTVDVSNIFDYTRSILAGRRRGNNIHDHGSYIAPRESRHILGDVILTLKDQLLMQRFSDTINICFSNHDPKGISTADIIFCGLLPPQILIEIPYRALLPTHLENLLIIGKAISCTHDGLAAVRMQSDLQNLGGAAGLAAALAIKQDVGLRAIDVFQLQQLLIDKEAIPPSAIEPPIEKETDLSALITNLQENEPWEWLEMAWDDAIPEPPLIAKLCYANTEEIVPLLKGAYQQENSNNRQLNFAHLLAWHGDDLGVDLLINMVQKSFSQEYPLPKRKGSTRFTQLLPDHGIMPEPCYLLYTLSRVHSKKCLPVFSKLVERICNNVRDYHDINKGLFHYVDVTAYTAERLVFPEFIPLLQKLLKLPELQDVIQTSGFQVDIIGERLAYLHLRIARALARCGSIKGLKQVAVFLQDNRALLRNSAHKELILITGEDYGTQYSKWLPILSERQDFAPVPWKEILD